MGATNLPGLRRRLASMLYESLLLLGVLAVLFMIPQLVIGVIFHTTLPGLFLWLHVFVALGLYFVWYWRHGGQTLAMQTWKLQLRSVRGTAPEMWQIWIRYVLSWPSLLFLGVGLIWALFDRDRQFLHDRLAGTRIVFKQD